MKEAGRNGRRTSVPAVVALVCVFALIGGVLISALAPSAHVESAQGESGVRISEVMTSNGSSMIMEDGSVPDWIELENISGRAVDLTGFALMTESKPNKAFAFPKGVLQPGEYVVIYCDDVGKSIVNGEYHAPFRLSAGGENIALIDKRGQGIDLVETPALARDQVYCRDASGAWQLSDMPTPGQPNVVRSEASEGESGRTIKVEPGALEITEAMAKNATFFPDENGVYQDYIEIHNRSGRPVDLSGWALSDRKDKLMRWQFPSITLPADGYLAVHCSGEARVDNPAHLHTDFKLSRDGEEIFLTDPDGVTVSSVHLPMLVADQAYSLVDGEWTSASAPSPGQPNTQAGAEAAAAAGIPANDKGIYITEILASSSKSNDWIEIYNGSDSAIDLSGYGLSDKASRPRMWQFPSGTVVQPGQYIGVFANGADRTDGSRMYSNFMLAQEGGYTITLSDPDGRIFDRLFVPAQYQDISYGRLPDLKTARYFATPTPGTANDGEGCYGRAPLPEYSVPGGMFKSGDVVTVEMKAPAGCQIYYTLDTTDPTQSSTLYTSPITISDTTILRTRVYGQGYLESYMDTQSYLYDVNNANGTVYVVSLVSDPYNLSSDEAGIMIKGPNPWPHYPFGSLNEGANFWMDWEREAHVEVFNPDGTTLISQECGIKLHGQFSRAEKQKAFKVIARSQYGSNRFQAAIFSKRPYTEYQSFLLRSSSEDGPKTRIRDSVLQMLARGKDLVYQETEIGVLYINGIYWGHYNLRERVCTSMICQFEGWEGEEDDLDLIKGNTQVMQGSNETMATLLEYVQSHDMNTDEAYQVLDNAIDIENYINYMIIEMYTGNTDTLNVKRYRNPNRSAKWRWVLFDLDWAFFTDTNSVKRWLTPGGMGNNLRTDNTLFIACMKNDRFRDRFLTRLGEEMATDCTPENILALAEDMTNRITPLLPEQFERWDMKESDYKKELKLFIDYAKTRPTRMLQFLKYCEYLPLTEEQMNHYFGDCMAREGLTYDQIPILEEPDPTPTPAP